MKTRNLFIAAVATALTVSACNCGDGSGNGNGNGNGDGGDVPPPETFSSFVIGLVNNQTNETAAPAAVSFDTADSEAADTYNSLFQ